MERHRGRRPSAGDAAVRDASSDSLSYAADKGGPASADAAGTAERESAAGPVCVAAGEPRASAARAARFASPGGVARRGAGSEPNAVPDADRHVGGPPARAAAARRVRKVPAAARA